MPLLLLPSIFLDISVFSTFPMSQLFASGGQSIGVSVSASILPVNYSGLISFSIWFDLLAVQGTQEFFSSTTVQNHQFFGAQPSLWTNSHIGTWLNKSIRTEIKYSLAWIKEEPEPQVPDSDWAVVVDISFACDKGKCRYRDSSTTLRQFILDALFFQ